MTDNGAGVRTESREDVSLTRTSLDSPVGELVLVERGPEVHGIAFDGRWERLRVWLERRFSTIEWETVSSGPAAAALARYFDGELLALQDLDADPGGSPFQREVWRILRTIGPGETWSYRDLAIALGRPTATRAVAQANAVNPVPLVIPCHRVIGSNGSLTGFGGGLDRKRWLLRHEAGGVEFRLR